MDGTGIEKLQEGTAINEIHEQINAGNNAVVLPKTMEYKSLEHLSPHRRRMRGHMTTTSLQGFVDFCNQLILQGYGDGKCFIERQHMRATFVADFGTVDLPGHCDLTAALALPVQPEFRELSVKNGYHFDQRAFIEWCEEWLHMIEFIDDTGQDVSASQALASLRAINVDTEHAAEHKTMTRAEQRTTLDAINISSTMALPYGIRVRCQPYESLTDFDFTARLHISARKDEKPIFTLHLLRLDTVLEEVATAFAELIENQINCTGIYQGIFKP